MDADNFERNKGRTFAKYWQSVTYIGTQVSASYARDSNQFD